MLKSDNIVPMRDRILTRYIVEQNDASFLADASGAFFGALFAFGFGLVAYFVQKKFDRYHKHKNAVVELEYLLQEHLDLNAGNRYLLQGAIETIDKGAYNFTILTPFRLPENLSLKLGNLELINRYAGYCVSASKLNHSMATWEKMTDQLHQAAIAGALTNVAKAANQAHLRAQALDLIRFLYGLEAETKKLVSYIRIFLRLDKNIWSIPLLEKKLSTKEIISAKEIESEAKKMEKEIEEIGKESRDRIDQIKKIKVDLNEN